MLLKILLGLAVSCPLLWAQTEDFPVDSAETAEINPPGGNTEESPPEEFSLPPVIEKKNAASESHQYKVPVNDQNIEYDGILRKITLEELPTKAYRQHYLGSEGYRPNTIALSVGGRTPGYGAFIDYSFNRLGIGISGSFRPIQIKQVTTTNDREITSNHVENEYFANFWAHYNLIPFRISPYLLLGLEAGFNTIKKFDVMGGIGIESRVGRSFTIFTEVVRHEVSKKSFAGLALGLAF